MKPINQLNYYYFIAETEIFINGQKYYSSFLNCMVQQNDTSLLSLSLTSYLV